MDAADWKRVGFTGTREGMTVPQYHSVLDWFNYPRDGSDPLVPVEVHHGCCVGADAEFHLLVIRNRVGGGGSCSWAEIHAHPSTLRGLTSAITLATADVTYDLKTPLDRNRAIVDACDVLIACPKGPEEQRSGTWSTVRYARRRGKPVVIVWPDGDVTEEKVVGGTES